MSDEPVNNGNVNNDNDPPENGGDNNDPKPGTPEHDAAMQAKFDGSHKGDEGNVGDVPDPDPPQKPDNVPDKFWDAEKGEIRTDDLLKSYTELETRHGKKEGGDNASKDNKSDGDGSSDDDKKNTAGLTAEEWQGFNDEFLENKGLSDESYKKLADKGYPREYVDAYIQGQQALVRESLNTLYNEAQGEDTYNQMLEWAANNLSNEEIDAFDKTITSGDMNASKLAVRGLFSQYQDATGVDGKHVKGNTGDKNNVVGFESHEQMKEAMRDKRYGKDKAYTAEVMRKVDLMEW